MAVKLRNKPVQARSTETLQRIKRSAREVAAELGRDRFTTADVAIRAGVSIGTIYRYFPDRISIMDALWPHRHDTAGLEERLERVEELARVSAIAAHALGHVEDERRFLDIVIVAQGDAG